MISGLGERLKKLREEQHLSQDEVAFLLNLKSGTIKQYENDTCQPATQTLLKISQVFCTTIDYLLGLDDNDFVSLSGLSPEEISMIENFNKAMIDKLKY